MSQENLVGGFFYPQDSNDQNRINRAKALGYKPPKSDLELAETSKAYSYPRIHSLGLDKNNNPITRWIDTDPVAIRRQLKLIEEAGF